MVHVYNEILLSHKKKNEIMPFASTDGLRDYHTKSERERQIPYVHSSIIYDCQDM